MHATYVDVGVELLSVTVVAYRQLEPPAQRQMLVAGAVHEGSSVLQLV